MRENVRQLRTKIETKHQLRPNKQSMANRNLEEEHNHNVYSIINNGGYNLGRPGNPGRYTRSRHITSVDDWDAVLDHLTLPPIAYETSGYIYDHSFGREQADLRLNAFPEVVLIQLPSTTPGWRRCILHIEEVENVGNARPLRQQLTGRYFPVPVSYHENHPIAEAIIRIFHTEAPDTPFYQSNEELVILTSPSHNDVWIRQVISLLVQPGNNFEVFDRIMPAVNLERASNVLPDPAVVREANRTIVIPEYDMDPYGALAASEQWRAMVYPAPATEEQRREVYATYAADQINIHRRTRIQFGYDFPDYPNPYRLPLNNDDNDANDDDNNDDNDDNDDNDNEHENNPADRIRANHPANAYIQRLYNAQNNDERARIVAVNIHEIVPPAPLPAALPVVHHRLRELDG